MLFFALFGLWKTLWWFYYVADKFGRFRIFGKSGNIRWRCVRRELIFARYIERTLRRYKSRRGNFVFGDDIFRRVLSVENNIYWQHYSEICCYFPKILEWFLSKIVIWCDQDVTCVVGWLGWWWAVNWLRVNMINNPNFLWQPNIKYIYGYGCLKIVDKLDLDPDSIHFSQPKPRTSTWNLGYLPFTTRNPVLFREVM